jgi:hypothetical protein
MGSYTVSATNAPHSVPVPLVALDDLFKDRSLARTPIRLIKIDVEGMEAEVLQGARDVLSRGCVEFVMFERNCDLQRGEPAALLCELGYSIHRLALGGRLRPMRTLPKSERPQEVRAGTARAIAAWLRGVGRLETLIATRSSLDLRRAADTSSS